MRIIIDKRHPQRHLLSLGGQGRDCVAAIADIVNHKLPRWMPKAAQSFSVIEEYYEIFGESVNYTGVFEFFTTKEEGKIAI